MPAAARTFRAECPALASRALSVALALACTPISPAARAQPADLPIPAATTNRYPPGVRVAKTAMGAVYTDARGRVLYGMDMRTLLRWGADPAQHCTGECARTWAPLLAPTGTQPDIAFPRDRIRLPAPAGEGAGGQPAADAVRSGFYTQRNAPDWTVIAGPQGPQWVYKGWHLVFTRREDKPGSTTFDGAENKTWNTLKFVPPQPKITAPAGIQLRMIDGAYVLADSEGRVLFTGKCAKTCAGWTPLGAGMASGPVGEWTVKTDGDAPQWAYRGKPVFISQENDPKQAPPSAKLLRP